MSMKVLHRKCAGIDVHAAFVTVCARAIKGRTVVYDEARFETTTRDLLALSGWLETRGISHVIMEATGVYWKPVWHILEPSFKLQLANAHEARNLPGSPRVTRTMPVGSPICWPTAWSGRASCRPSRSVHCAI